MGDAVKTPNVVEATNKPGLYDKLEDLKKRWAPRPSTPGAGAPAGRDAAASARPRGSHTPAPGGPLATSCRAGSQGYRDQTVPRPVRGHPGTPGGRGGRCDSDGGWGRQLGVPGRRPGRDRAGGQSPSAEAASAASPPSQPGRVREGLGRVPGDQETGLPTLLLRLLRRPPGHPVQRERPRGGRRSRRPAPGPGGPGVRSRWSPMPSHCAREVVHTRNRAGPRAGRGARGTLGHTDEGTRGDRVPLSHKAVGYTRVTRKLGSERGTQGNGPMAGTGILKGKTDSGTDTVSAAGPQAACVSGVRVAFTVLSVG